MFSFLHVVLSHSSESAPTCCLFTSESKMHLIQHQTEEKRKEKMHLKQSRSAQRGRDVRDFERQTAAATRAGIYMRI